MANPGVEEVSEVSVGSISDQAHLMASKLLEAYYYQDQRESYLLTGKPEQALDAGSKALSRMATVYEHEFSSYAAKDARTAGKEFMRGLFLQDEIENWHLLKQKSDDTDLQEPLVSDWNEPYGPMVINDERWKWSKERLSNTCEMVDIADEYADDQVQFWLLHGQLNEYWEEIAIEAHTHKLRSMVDDPPSATENRLGEYFVEGVKRHNDWRHRNRDEDIEPVEQIVAPYYQRILDLREDE